MTNQTTYSIVGPFGWLAASSGTLVALLQFSPSLAASFACASALSIASVVMATRPEQKSDSVLLPLLGAVLFAFITWITISMVPSSSAEIGVSSGMVLTARSIVALSVVVLLLPVLALAEMLFSVVAVQAIARLRGKSILGGELQVVSMISNKFGNLLGAVNR
ncbi:MAG: hypothetical protein V3V04_04580 [Rhizobiaceae bacterium]